VSNKEGKKELDYNKKKKEIIKFLDSKDNAIMVLATSDEDRVIARNVLIANNEFDLYFFSWGQSRKCKQIRKNPNVALCKDDVQIEGSAEILGGLLDEKNKEYTDLLRNKFPGSVEKWENRPGMVIVRVIPKLIATASTMTDDYIYIDYLDLEKCTAYTKKWAYY
jgi:general stress protein 26